MKIRWDFVTNSSSTNYMIICKGVPNKEVFLIAMGAPKKESPLRHLFEELYGVLCENMIHASKAIRGGYWGSAKDIPELIEREFSKISANRANEALQKGLDIWIGYLRSDSDNIGAFFCTESVIVNHPKLYINALNCTW